MFTPGYAAPELVGGALREDGGWIAPGSRCPRYGLEVDWWALGCIMYMMMAGCMLFSEKTDLLEYVERYKSHRGRAWLRSRCTMTETELQVLYGVRSFLFFFFCWVVMTKCDSYHFRSCSTSQSAGDLPLRSSRGNHFSRMKSRCFAGASISTPLIFLVLRRLTEVWTNLHILSTVLAPLLRAFIVPKSLNTGWRLLTQRSPLIS